MDSLPFHFLPQRENVKKIDHSEVFGYRYHSIVPFVLTECRSSAKKGEGRNKHI